MAIRLWSPDGENIQTFTCSLADVMENGEDSPKWYDGAAMIEELKNKAGWKVTRAPFSIR